MSAVPVPPAEMPLGDLLAAVRHQLAALLAQANATGLALPSPHEVLPEDDHLPGPLWRPASGWMVHAVDPPGDLLTTSTIFVETPETIVDGDVIAVTTPEGRALALALLAACDHADARHTELMSNVTPHHAPLGEASNQGPGGMMATAECPITELPVEMCAHCRGDVLPGEIDDGADPDYGPPFIAQYEGHCDGCGNYFAAGDTIRSDGEMGWLCESCGAA